MLLIEGNNGLLEITKIVCKVLEMLFIKENTSKLGEVRTLLSL